MRKEVRIESNEELTIRVRQESVILLQEKQIIKNRGNALVMFLSILEK